MTEREWEVVLQRFSRAWQARDYERASAEVQVALKAPPRISGRAFAQLGFMRQDQGLRAEASKAFGKAIRRLSPGSYWRYRCQVSLGEFREQEGDINAAVRLYRAALRDSATGRPFISDRAIGKLTRLRNQRLSHRDRVLIEHALKRSWRVKRLGRAPDCRDISKAIELLVAAPSPGAR